MSTAFSRTSRSLPVPPLDFVSPIPSEKDFFEPQGEEDADLLATGAWDEPSTDDADDEA